MEGAVAAERLLGSLSYLPKSYLNICYPEKATEDPTIFEDVWIFQIFLEAQFRHSHFLVPRRILLNTNLSQTRLP